MSAPPLPPRSAPPVPPATRRLLVVLLVGALLTVLLPLAPVQADQGRWRWPLPPPHRVLSPFDAPEHPYGPGHRGIDLAAPAEGAPVRAVEAGTVRFSGTVAGRGVVSVVHADGLISTYEPVRGDLEAGSPVAAGEVLGTLGAGSSHCPGRACLHLGARRGTAYLDPLPLLGLRGPSVLLPWRGDGGAGRDGPGGADPSFPVPVRSLGAALAAAVPSTVGRGR